MLGFYTRPTIPFKLECETPNSIKQKFSSDISEALHLVKSLSIKHIYLWPLWKTWLYLQAILLCKFLYSMCSCFIICIKLFNRGWLCVDYTSTIVKTLIGIGGAFMVFIYTYDYRSYPRRVRQSTAMIEALRDNWNGCIDQETMISSWHFEQLEKAVQHF